MKIESRIVVERSTNKTALEMKCVDRGRFANSNIFNEFDVVCTDKDVKNFAKYITDMKTSNVNKIVIRCAGEKVAVKLRGEILFNMEKTLAEYERMFKVIDKTFNI